MESAFLEGHQDEFGVGFDVFNHQHAKRFVHGGLMQVRALLKEDPAAFSFGLSKAHC